MTRQELYAAVRAAIRERSKIILDDGRVVYADCMAWRVGLYDMNRSGSSHG